MKIFVANGFSDNLRVAGDWPSWWVQRVAWFADDGDILILPTEPQRDFLAYVTALTRVRIESISVVLLPSSTVDGRRVPFVERIADADFQAALHTAIAGRPIERIFALWPDSALINLADSIGAELALPGARFIGQDGGRLVNSKSVFRAVAAGTGIRIPEGAVCQTSQEAHHRICRLFDGGDTVILKQDYLTGGRGNLILTTGKSFDPIGAREVVTLQSDRSLQDFLNMNWEGLCGREHNLVVVERYFRGSRAVFAEYAVEDNSVELEGTGELLSAPFACGQVMPPVGFDPRALTEIAVQGLRLATAVAAMGYRGCLSADAIVTPNGDVFFTEYNGRVTGSTHIYAVIGKRVIGSGFGVDRTILERVWPEGWSVASFETARAQLTVAGLAYDPVSRIGVVLTNAFDTTSQGVMYCIAAENLAAARQIEHSMTTLFAGDAAAKPPPLPVDDSPKYRGTL